MLLIAHRGFRINVDENTFSAFNESIRLGMDYIELDVQLNANEELYVLHDATLDRTMQTKGRIKNLTSEQLRGVRSKTFNYPILSLEELIEKLYVSNNFPIKLMIELKGKGTAEKSVGVIKKYGVEQSIVFSSRDVEELGVANKFTPEIPLCLNITSCKEFTVSQLKQVKSGKDLPLPFAMISLRSSEIGSDFSSKCKDLGIIPLAWAFMKYRNPLEKYQELMELGIGGILLDDPSTVDPLRRMIEEKKA